MTRYTLILSTVASLMAGASYAEPVRIATEGAFPPFNFVDASGALQGFEVDLANAICAEAKLECTLSAQQFDGLIPGLQADKFDVIMASMNITDDRLKVISFTDPYYRVPQRFVAKKDSGIEMTKEGVTGKTIGVVSGTIHENYVNATYGDVATVSTYQTLPDALRDLEAGRIDLYIDGELTISESFLKQPEGKDFAFVGDSLSDPAFFGIGVGAGVRQEDSALKGTLNAAIKAVRANGTYDTIQAKYFDTDIFPK